MEKIDSSSNVDADQRPGLHKVMFDPATSSAWKYREMVIGSQGWWVFLYYEFVTLFFGSLRGALGLGLRKIFFRPLFKHVGKEVVFGANLVLRQPHKIILGDQVIIDDDCTLDAKGTTNQGIRIGNMVTIGRFSSIVSKNADIEVGSHVNIGTNVKVIAANEGKIRIGNSIDIGSGTHFCCGSYDYSDVEKLPSSQRLGTKGITVGDLAWIGSRVIILDGNTIGEKSIVGAGAVVTQDIPPNSIATGVPAKVKKSRI